MAAISLFSGFMPDSLYTIHTHGLPDSLVSFYSVAELRKFLDTTTSVSDTTKALILQIISAQHLSKQSDETSSVFGTLFVGFIVMLCICAVSWALITVILNVMRGGNNTQQYFQNSTLEPSQDYNIYKGRDLKINDEIIAAICLKYNSFFRDLTGPEEIYWKVTGIYGRKNILHLWWKWLSGNAGIT